MRFTLKSTRREEPVVPMVPILRIPLVRVVTPFFLSAVCMYAVLIVCTYPLLTGESNRMNRLVFHDGIISGDQVEGYVERIQRRNVREVGEVVRSHARRREKMDIIDRVLRMRKRAAQVDVAPTDDLDVDGVDDALNDAPKQYAEVAHDVDKDIGGIQWQPAEPEIAVKKEPYYNKLITVPKSERYIDEPVDAHTYGYIHRPDVCRKGGGQRLKIQLIFMVTTAPRNFERRRLVRETYGNKQNWPDLHTGGFRVIFLLGAVGNSTLQREIDAEFAAHADIVQENFVDSYANLTLKTVMGLKWVTNYCRQATFTMKIDDDSMIHQNRLLRMLNNATTTNFTAAEALINAPVLRNTSSKYYISEKYFPAPTYPPYLNGPGYLISTDLTEGLYRAATSIPLFPWEDVFLGLCLHKLGVVPEVRHDFMLIIATFSQISDKVEAVKLFRYFTVVSNLEPEYMMLMWEACHFRLSKTIS